MDNTPDGIKALLDKLKSSQAWQQTIAASDPPPPPDPAPAPTPGSRGEPPTVAAAQPSVASLLAQLADASAGHPPPSVAESRPSGANTSPVPGVAPPQTSTTGSDKHDLHSFSFQQTLSHLAQLSTEPGFTESIRRIQNEQSALESQLWDERLAIKQKHQEKVKVAVTKANLIGSGRLSQFEADALTQAYKSELHKFDTQRVIVAWDALITKQQTVLESLGVPGMFVSHLTSDTEKQQRVVRVLESIVDGPN